MNQQQQVDIAGNLPKETLYINNLNDKIAQQGE